MPRLPQFQTPEIVFGSGSLAEAGYAAERLGARRPVVVTDPGLLATRCVDELLDHLREAGLVPTLWHGVTPNPKDHEILAGFQKYAESGCDVTIAIGGGYCTDAGKGVAVLSGDGGSILDYAGVDQFANPTPLALAAGLKVESMPPREAAEMLADHVRSLADEVRLPRGLRHLGVSEENIGHLAKNTLGDACLSTNPRSADRRDVEGLFLAAP